MPSHVPDLLPHRWVTIATTTREVSYRAASTFRLLLTVLLSGVAAGFAVWIWLALRDSKSVGGDFGYRLGWYSAPYLAEGAIMAALGVVGLTTTLPGTDRGALRVERHPIPHLSFLSLGRAE